MVICKQRLFRTLLNCSIQYVCDFLLTLMTTQVWEGDGVVKSARKLIGATNPLEAEAGTIRGDFAIQTGRNVVHGSDSPENGIREAGKKTSLSCCILSAPCCAMLQF